MAMSVPVPMAMPTLAWVKAGASLMPSPTKATRPNCSCSFCTSATLPSGSTSASTWSMPTRRAMASAVRWLSPVIMAVSRPIWCNSWIAATESSFSVSATAMTPARRPSTATSMAVLASSSSRRSVSSNSAGSGQCSSISLREPTSTRSPFTEAMTPLPRTAWNSCGSARVIPSTLARSTIARPRGCSEPRSAEAAACSTVLSSQPCTATTSVTSGLPLVMVPVLSKTTTRTSFSV